MKKLSLNMDGVKGHLILKGSSIAFQPKNANQNNQGFEHPLANVEQVNKSRRMNIGQRAIELVLSNNEKLFFMKVKNFEEFFKELNERWGKSRDGGATPQNLIDQTQDD
jgi:hypothetical protein